MSEPFFTVGHSDRTSAGLIELLQESRVERVVDVRRLPGSRRFPQFDEDTLRETLAAVGIELRRAPGLTGRRPVSKDVPFAVNAWWQNRSFHNYADHALSDEFQDALAGLREEGSTVRSAMMCSEAVWWRCHRRIITDHLLARGEEVRHILGADHVDAATLSLGAVVGPDGTVPYPASTSPAPGGDSR